VNLVGSAKSVPGVLIVLVAACAAQTPRPDEKERMMHPQSAKTFEDISKLARTYSMGAVPDEDRQSLPIPVRLDSGTAIEFFFAPAHARPKQPVDLFPPAFAITLHTDGSLIRLWRVAPRDFGLNHDQAQPVGQFGLPEGWTFEEYNRRHARLLQCLDLLLPQFAKNSRAGEVKAAAREYLAIFKELMEPPLAPYYEAVGKAFLAWVRAASQ
jgi:hypothetical protein